MTMTDESRTLRLCFCQDRIVAMGTHSLRYSAKAGGWFFQDAPTRSMSSTARFRAFIDRAEYDHTDHTGEPMYWLDCPFCGGVLPGVEREGDSLDHPFGFGQADGNETGG